jgi:hypothetical protein
VRAIEEEGALTRSMTLEDGRGEPAAPLAEAEAEASGLSAVDSLVEDGEVPAPSGGLRPIREWTTPPDPDWVRTGITVAILGLLAAVVGVACWGWLSGWRDEDEIETFGLIMAPVITLSGTILGFYFSTRPND